jgi:hypothetical protein
MFGAPAEPAQPAAAQPEAEGGAPAPVQEGVTPAAAQSGAPNPPPAVLDARDAVLGASGSATPMFTEEPAPSDPLTLGGLLYLRMQSTGYEHTNPGHYGISAPTLLDLFLDARPNDRVRGFALGRMSYDPLLPSSQSNLSSAAGMGAASGTAGSTSISPSFGYATSAPRVLLDQLWLRFDIAHTVFVTAGRQHVRWGTARFWTPADFLHVRKRNPLDVFDARTGTTMVKLHLPIESQAWNFYAYGVTENQAGRPDLRTPAGALRAEIVLGQLELGLGAFGRASQRAKFAGDVSFGLGDIDFYGEVAVIDGRDISRVRYAPDATVPMQPQINGLPQPLADAYATSQQLTQAQAEADALYPVYRNSGYRPQAVVGLSYSRKYNDNDTFQVGIEYFYNAFGYDNANVYSGLIWPHSSPLENPASFFYFGKHYGALFVSFPAPFKLDLHTFTLSTLGNLSDRSFTTRFDYALTLLTHLRFEAFASAVYGERGEFRFTVASLPSFNAAQLGVPRTTVFTVGLGLRLAI